MNDLISRQALMKEFADFVRASNNSDFAQAPTWNNAVSLVESMPSAQPERKKGKWIRSGEGSYEVYECSSCGNPWYEWWASAGDSDWMSKKLKYCPNCGADMRGDGNDN